MSVDAGLDDTDGDGIYDIWETSGIDFGPPIDADGIDNGPTPDGDLTDDLIMATGTEPIDWDQNNASNDSPAIQLTSTSPSALAAEV